MTVRSALGSALRLVASSRALVLLVLACILGGTVTSRAASAQSRANQDTTARTRHYKLAKVKNPPGTNCLPGVVCTMLIVNDTTPPTINTTPYGGNVSASSISVTIDYCDDNTLNANSRHVTLNGSAVALAYATSTASGCRAHATSSGTVNLTPGSNVLHADICDNNGNCTSLDTYYVRVVLSASVTPDSASATLAPSRDSSQVFTLTNSSSVAVTFTLSGRCTGGALNTTICGASPTSLPLNAGQTGTFTISYRTGGSGGTTGRVAGVAQASGVSDSGWVNVSVPATYGVAVSPRGGTKVVTPSSSQSQVFTVTNGGNTSMTFNFTPSCSGTIVTAGSCVARPSSATLSPGATTTDTVVFTTTTAGTGTAVLNVKHAASPALARDSGWVSLATTAPLASVSLARATPGTTIEKGACLHFSVRPEVGSECGVLRVTHSLPPVRTLNKARAPTLVYYYDQAAYWQVIGVNVARAAAAAVPDSVRAILYQNTGGTFTELQRRAWGGSAWSGTTAQRVALTMENLAGGTSRIVSYRVQVDFKSGGTWVPAAVPADAELAVVRREMSAGWHVAGLEALYPQSSNVVLWVGGDGSTRKYTLQDTVGGKRVFTTPALDRLDTLLQNVSDNAYTRQAGNGLRIIFDATGLHTQTINRLGHVTTFTYVAGTRRLSTITVPPSSASLVYRFDYSANGTLASVSAPGPRSQSGPGFETSRVTTLTPGATAGVITRITDPDSTHVDFEYQTGYGGGLLMNAFKDRRGVRTALDQEGYAPTLSGSHTPIGSQEVTQYFRTPSSMGASPTAAPIPIDSVYARYDGPRADVVDVIKIWLGDFGVPVKVVDPIGATTTVVYGDSRFPLLATRVTRPRGLVSAAGYDWRGNVVADTVYNPLGDNRNAVTTYAWDSKWDKVTRVISPTGIVTETKYDTTNANPLWTQTGGSSHRANFGYYTSGLAAGLAQSTQQPTGEQDEYRYDPTLGNLHMVRTPMGFPSLAFTDAMGRDTMSVTPIKTSITIGSAIVPVSDTAVVLQTGMRTRMHYDLAGRVKEQWTENGPDTAQFHFPAETLQVRTDYNANGQTTAVRRRAIPDINSIEWITDSWVYDTLGRAISEPRLSKRYDLAGNVVWTSHGDSSVYDAAGRVIRHLMPAVSWLPRGDAWFMAEPSGAAADVETFEYGLEGELLKADNRYAKIRRGYYRNGALAGDTIAVRDYWLSGDPDSGFPIGHEYDLEGRPIVLRHNLVGNGTVQYSYDATTGALHSVTDPQNNSFIYTEDAAGRLTSLGFPDLTENYRYDADSRMRWINGDSLVRDARGKVIWKGTGTSSIYQMKHTALGNLKQLIRPVGEEDYTPDAFGNPSTVSISGTAGNIWKPSSDGDWKKYYSGANGSIAGQTKYQEGDMWAAYEPDGDYQFGEFGNQVVSMSFDYIPNTNPGMVDTTRTYSYYDGNNHLRFVLSTKMQRYWNADSVRIMSTEYRYDALGRRLMTRYRGPYECQTRSEIQCRGTLDQQFWDGAEVLLETRAVEVDKPASVASLDGTAIYTNGPEIDVPLSIARHVSDPSCDYIIFPHADWRGRLSGGSGSRPSCSSVEWPANELSAYRAGPLSSWTAPWNGSLIDQGSDQTGLQYMRNRYYDPKSGQFTQADPIGLAGGLNVYGYASGDPITFADPFGLCPPCYPGMYGMKPLEGSNGPWKSLGIMTGITAGVLTGIALGPVVGEAGLGLLLKNGPAIARAGAAAAGAGGAVAVKDAVQRGLVGSSGKLVQVLTAIESEAAASNPTSAGQALDVVVNATKSVNLEPGVLTTLENGALQLKNVGGVITTLGPKGSILVERGKDILLNIPK